MISLYKLVRRPTRFILALTRILVMVSGILTPLALSWLIDDVQKHAGRQFILCVAINVLVFVVNQFLFFVDDLVKGESERQSWVDICQNLVPRLMFSQDRRLLTQENLGQQLGQNYERLKDFVIYHPINMGVMFLKVVVIIALVFYYNRGLALVLIVAIPSFLILSNRYSQAISQQGQQVLDKMKVTRTYLLDLLAHYKLVAKRGLVLFRPFSDYLSDYSVAKRRLVKQEAIFENILAYALLNCLLLVSFIWSAYQVRQGRLSFGSLYAIQLYVSALWSPFEYMIDTYKDYLVNKSALKSLQEILRLPYQKGSASEIASIAWRDLQLLDSDGVLVTSIADGQLLPGELLIVTGANGSGKTLFIETLLGYHNGYSGRLVPEALAQSDQAIYAPAGVFWSGFYSSVLEEEASNGQKKMHQLQEVFKEDKALYIFDEPTNFLDAEHRQQIYSSVEGLLNKGKMVIVVTHDQAFMTRPQAKRLVVGDSI